jgi:argininosuccinate synthase
MKKIVLAYSGGLDTSVSIHWLKEHYNAEIITLTLDLGQEKDIEAIRRKALTIGATKAITIDAKEEFIKDFVFPALKAGAIYEGDYPLSTALARPLIAKYLVKVAREEGATAVAHGCTGKGNDQARFDVSTGALAPDLEVIAPVREWGMTREEEIEYAQKHGIPVPATLNSPYSIDANLWGRSIECGILEDPWQEPPEEVFEWTKPPEKAPSQPRYLQIDFEEGIPVALDGEKLSGAELVSRLNLIAGEYGVGRIDHIENRLVGIKSREVYEAPAAVVLYEAHRKLEKMTLTKEVLRFNAQVALTYADLVYNGLWFSPLKKALDAYVDSVQKVVTGTVRVKLEKGVTRVVGVRSPYSLYDYNLATYDKADAFDHKAAVGFIKLWGLPLRVKSKVQGI